jgi:hypothetical protein
MHSFSILVKTYAPYVVCWYYTAVRFLVTNSGVLNHFLIVVSMRGALFACMSPSCVPRLYVCLLMAKLCGVTSGKIYKTLINVKRCHEHTVTRRT